MMESSADMYQNQKELSDNIQRVGINIKKDGWARKNADYFKRRMQMLETLWGEFQFNHDRFTTEESGKHPYFTSALYTKTRQIYQDVKDLIISQHQQSSKQLQSSTGKLVTPTPSTSQQVQESVAGEKENQSSGEEGDTNNPSETHDDSDRDRSPSRQQQHILTKRDIGSNSKLDDLLRKQTANFKAFMRAVANIQVEFITEKWEFEDALQILQARWSAVDKLHWEIECELNGDKIVTYDERYTRYEMQFNSVKRALNTKMWANTHQQKTTPKLEIPVFHGKYNQWMSFKDLFTEAIHNNISLSPAQKMQFLKSKVHGEAERLIQHLQISSENYSMCWEILNRRFNNKKHIFATHFNMLLNMPIMQQQSLTALKRMHDVTVECLHAIKNLEVDITSWDPMLVHMLSLKLDSVTLSDYNDSLKNSRELPVLQEFLDYIEAKFTSLESSQRKQDVIQKTNGSNSQSQGNSYPKKQYHNNYKYNQSDSNKVVTKSFHTLTLKCPLCNNEHGIYRCAKFLEMNNDAKLSTVNKLQLCVNCLFSHNGRKCTSTYRCRKCKGQHNAFLTLHHGGDQQSAWKIMLCSNPGSHQYH